MMLPENRSFEGYWAIRKSVALEEDTDLQCYLIRGREAFSLLDHVCPCSTFLQNGQIKHTFLMDEEAIPFADVYICRNGDDAYLIGYWSKSIDIKDWFDRYKGPVTDYTITEMTGSHIIMTLHGPYAWEMCAKSVGTEILGMPYLSVMKLNSMMVFRAGLTGEYGYHLMIPAEQKEEWTGILFSKGTAFDLASATSDERKQCSLENFFFDLDREGQYRLTPPELQLQWRVSLSKANYPGSAAMQNIREKGWTRRLTCFVTKEPVYEDDDIFYGKELVGKVLAAGYSPLRKDYVGKALITRPFWHAGLNCFQVNNNPLETISAPAIDNLSTHINPNIDSYFARKEK